MGAVGIEMCRWKNKYRLGISYLPLFSEQKLPVFWGFFMRLPVPSKSDFEMTACPKRRVDGSLAKTLLEIHLPRPSIMLRSVNLALSPFRLRSMQIPVKRFFLLGECGSEAVTAKILPKTPQG